MAFATGAPGLVMAEASGVVMGEESLLVVPH